MAHILIVEDNPRISAFIEKGLRAAGHQTEVATDGRTGLTLATHGGFDLMVLDLGLPGLDGFELLQALRGQGHELPVIVLTARDSVEDTVAVLEGGANDYMAKPFQFAELLARIRVRLADTPDAARGGADALTLEAGGLVLDQRTRIVEGAGLHAELTSREFGLLTMLMRHAGQVLSRQQLLAEVWGVDHDVASNVVDVCVRQLRQKVGPGRIETVRGAGYRFR
ncbi:DNA-binding response regulator, OmpR family, contains REC and winged-helix (wHTH) domain [Kytococcus aerolatus]|uniref:DNA-binding response regulator, OmpR family, contains REC and winged-helix (WHTH) domain n=1 Tax=Kytococcus aerolatus TaxID=592308 RepID=A0A212TB83_9MICO|nr:response regulator transcription factor [Kytococcus aerolatus]SNC63091.1 DNA-binding response regulator, OmpR family, contains REC and winged-helix (wHTH) domain [Kytococcus aerolatus]